MHAILENPAFWALILFFIPLFFRIPVAVALGFSAIAVTYFWDLGLQMMSYNVFANIAKYPLLSIPFFIMAGNIMEKAGIADKIIVFIKGIVGDFTGGLAIAAIAVAVFWGAVSGSTVATVAAIGIILIPGMVKSGYDKPFSTAVISVSSGLAIIVPPSITFILYAVVSGTSVGAMFAAGFFPAFVIAGFLMGSAYLTSKKHGYRGEPRKNGIKGILKDGVNAFWALLTPVVILGGIYGGIFTPTEAAAVACFYGLFVGIVIYRRIGWKDIYNILVETVSASAIGMTVAATAGLYSWVGSTIGLIESAASFLISISPNQYVILLMIYFILFIGGMFLDGTAMVFVFVPIFLPVMQRLNWNPVWFGVMMTIMVAVGTVTPPVALNLFVGCRISGLTMEELTPPVMPLLLALLLALVVLSIFPSITLFLPQFLGFIV
jgi:C4-dicarboxylate transporter DctM subunit